MKVFDHVCVKSAAEIFYGEVESISWTKRLPPQIRNKLIITVIVDLNQSPCELSLFNHPKPEGDSNDT